MLNSSAEMIKRIAHDHESDAKAQKIDLSKQTPESLFFVYKLIFIEIEKNMKGKPAAFPEKSLEETEDALVEIFDNFLDLTKQSIKPKQIYDDIMRIMPMLKEAVAQIGKASTIRKETFGNPQLRYGWLDQYSKALLECRSQVVEINKQLEGS